MARRCPPPSFPRRRESRASAFGHLDALDPRLRGDDGKGRGDDGANAFRIRPVRNLLLFFHLAGAIFWMGGMAFAVMALRPALHADWLPPQRLPLMVQVLRRFFAVVIASIALLLASGVPLLLQVPGAQAPRGWHVMAGIGIVMMLLFAHLCFAPWKRLQRAVAAQDWPQGGKWMNQVTMLVKINLGLGWAAIAAVVLWR